jgi:hypothetical protein
MALSNEVTGKSAMTIPPASHPAWMQLLQGKVNWQLESLPIKIFLGSAKLQLARDASSTQLDRLVRELRDVFVRNEKLHSVQKDLTNFK